MAPKDMQKTLHQPATPQYDRVQRSPPSLQPSTQTGTADPPTNLQPHKTVNHPPLGVSGSQARPHQQAPVHPPTLSTTTSVSSPRQQQEHDSSMATTSPPRDDPATSQAQHKHRINLHSLDLRAIPASRPETTNTPATSSETPDYPELSSTVQKNLKRRNSITFYRRNSSCGVAPSM